MKKGKKKLKLKMIKIYTIDKSISKRYYVRITKIFIYKYSTAIFFYSY